MFTWGTGRTREAACRLVRPGGVICHAGLQDDASGIDTRRLTLQEVSFIGNYCYTVVDLLASIDAIHNGRLGNLDWIEQRPYSSSSRRFFRVAT